MGMEDYCLMRYRLLALPMSEPAPGTNHSGNQQWRTSVCSYVRIRALTANDSEFGFALFRGGRLVVVALVRTIELRVLIDRSIDREQVVPPARATNTFASCGL